MALVYDSKKRIYTLKGKYKNAKGKWVDYEKTTPEFQFKKKSEAKAADIELRKYLSKCSENKISSDRQTFSDIADQYFKEKRRMLKATTIQTDSKALKKVDSLFDLFMDEITTDKIQDVLDDMDYDGYSLNYIDKIRLNIGRIFKYAVSKHIISANPMNDVQAIKRPNEVKDDEIVFWEPNEFLTFISNVDDFQDYVFFSYLYHTGCRKGESLALNWEDIDLIKSTFRINKTCSQSVDGEAFVITPPKTENSYRTKLMPKVLLEAMTKYYETRSKFYMFNRKCFVFGSLDRPYPTSTLDRHFKKYQKLADGWVSKKQLSHIDLNKSGMDFMLNDVVTITDGLIKNNPKGYRTIKKYFKEVIIDEITNDPADPYPYHVTLPIKKIKIHGLRHSHAAFLISSGCNIKAIADRLGDTVEVLLKTYAHLFHDADSDLVSVIDEKFDYVAIPGQENSSNLHP